MDRFNTDPFWNHVVMMNDGNVKCEFCERPFPKGTSISRIKWHLSGEKRRGVAICGLVPKDVQEAAFLAMRGGNKRQNTIACSSNVNVNDNAISSCPLEENNEVDNLARYVRRIQMAAVQGNRVAEGRTSSPAETGNLMENMAGEMMQIDRGEASQAPDTVGQAIGRNWDERSNFLMEDDMENGTRGVAQPGSGASSSGGLTRDSKTQKSTSSMTHCSISAGMQDDNKKE